MDFAVVGMDCILPGADGVDAWIARGRGDATALAPVDPARWPMPPEPALDATPGAPDAVTTLIGGFVPDAPLDPSGLDRAGVDIDALDPLFRQVLRVVRGALGALPRERADLLLANLSIPSTGALRVASRPWHAWLAARGADVAWLEGGDVADLAHGPGPADLAKRALGLGGRAAALDAACASGLYAVTLACDRLEAGLCDVAIAAGAQRADSAYLFLGFSQLRALSKSGTPRPLDRRSDGLVIGEGAAAIALKRLADAERDGDVIHAVIRGAGLGNDGRKGNLLAPDASGQLRALRAAHDRAGVAPASVGYVECHATGTPLGDAVEVDALAALHEGRDTPLVLSSVKGLIGHTITVAGLAGLLRAVGAVRDGVLPHTPDCDPIDAIDGERLRVLATPEPWTSATRRAGVSAFGFGGTNAHVLIENVDAPREPRPASATPAPEPLAVIAVGARIGAARGADVLASALLDGRSLIGPAPVEATRGLIAAPRGAWVDAIHVDPTRFRIPPRELIEILPQQLAFLDVAADALAQVSGLDPSATGSVAGMGIDLHALEPVLRQLVADPDRDAVTGPLTAGRVQGMLPNFVANRVAAALDLRGPSYTVSAGADSGPEALRHAARLLARDVVDAVVVGASDFRYLGALHDDTPVGEGAVALVVRRLADAEARGETVLAVLDPSAPITPTHHAVVGDCGAADHMVALLADVLAQARARGHALPPASPIPARSLRVPHSGPPVGAPTAAFDGGGGRATVPRPLPRRGDERSQAVVWMGEARPALAPLRWSAWTGAPAPSPERPPAAAAPPGPAAPQRTADPRRAPPPSRVAPRSAAQHHPASATPSGAHASPLREAQPANPHLLAALQPTALVQAMARSTAALADAHAVFLEDQRATLARIAALADSLDRAATALTAQPNHPATTLRPAPPTAPSFPPPQWPGPDSQSPGAEGGREAGLREESKTIPSKTTVPIVPSEPVLFDRSDLQRFSSDELSSVLGPSYADLDAIVPRVRLPKPPLLLVSRVLALDAQRGDLGASRIVTEYDLDPDADWAWEGKPPLCVVVESGQADLFLCAVIGTDAITKGEKLYRLLDCDLTFHGDRPACGETLRHDIRIKRFARLGDKLLFYFEYDCTRRSDGSPVLTMREGCAGFFSPAELARPHGVDPTPVDLPQQAPVVPLIAGAPEKLDDAAIRALTAGRYADALGVAFAPADGSSLRLPPSRWGLLDRVTHLALAGAPHGLGRVIAEQDLADDDWFNPIHFQDDPCMPGTLMFDGCAQALQVWLMATGAPAAWRDASFEPIPEVTARLRCRGQVAPGHRRLVYDVRVKEAALEPTPYAIADVVLHVDGTPIVTAHDVAIRIVGTPAPLAAPPPAKAVPEAALLEFAIGRPSRAFGPTLAAHDDGPRLPRIPGPPLLMMHRVVEVEGERGVLAAGCSATVAFDVRPDGWAHAVDDALPLGALLEVALQPCGWLTAWQGSALALGGDVYFRNLGGTWTRHDPVPPDAGTLTTRATLKSLSRSAGMLLTFFDFEVRAGDTLIARGDTHFGYFTPAALAAQKGLGLSDDDAARRAAWRARSEPAVDADDTFPRADWRRIDRVTTIAPDQGPAGLGYYEAEAAVDPSAWFFTAHFHQDPVMPGSLGLDGLQQLAAFALRRSLGRDAAVVQALDAPATWRYRGQVTRERARVSFALEVTSLDPDTGVLRGDGIVLADGLPIYAFEGMGVQVLDAAPVPRPDSRREGAAHALLDAFHVDGDTGAGTLRLDPARHPWLRDHCPTLVIPAVPLAFAAEIAAEAATLLRPGRRVVGLPKIDAERWIHTADGPVDLLVAAVADGDTFAVTLAVHHENARFPKLSGPKPHMRAIVRLGDAWAPAPPPLAPLADAAPVPGTAADYYAGGLTFHGPVLHGMTDLGARGPRGAEATFHPRPDATLVGPGAPAFVLDPLLLDTATHPMWSGAPEVWGGHIPPGRLAYPLSCEGLALHGPRPVGPVRCRLDLVSASPRGLVFDVRLTGPDGPWATFRWTETLVDGGPLLGRDADTIAAFCKARLPADVRVGRRDGAGWRVAPGDLVEPIPGTLLRLLGTDAEARDAARADDPLRETTARLAAKEALRDWLRDRIGRDVHPATLRVVPLRPAHYVVTDATALTLDEQTDLLHPTRLHVAVRHDPDGTAVAEVHAP